MKAKFIIGRAGAGKTSRCLDEIVQNIEGGWEKPLLLLVPNQFSLEMEKKLVAKTGGKGMDISQVLSFERLSYRVFSLYGRPEAKTLDETGKAALLRKIIYDKRDTLSYYGGTHGKEGFITQICGLITEFYKYGVDAGTLDALNKSAELKNTPLQSKIADFSVILKEFSAFLGDEYITLEQNLDLLAKALPEAFYFHGAKIWLDGFFRFTEQDYSVIRELAEIAGELTVSLTMPETSDLYERPHSYDPFFETKSAAARIIGILNDCGCGDLAAIKLVKNEDYGYAKPLMHLERSYFDFSPKPYAKSGDCITITKAVNIYDEADKTASEIISLVRDNNYRYKEIAVCACDLENYEHVLRDTLKRNGIPFFIDMSRQIYNKRLVEAVRALIETGVSNWSSDSVIRMLRTGLFDLTDAEIDILENYILEYGIKGYKWRLEWKSGANKFDLDTMNRLRARVLGIVSPFLDIYKNKKTPTVKAAAAAVYTFIDKNNIAEKLLLIEENKREAEQVWNIVASVFEKLVEILGGEKTDLRTFHQIVEGALSGAIEGFIPQTSDAVILGDIKRTRLSEIKALFVVGLNDGVLPSSKNAQGLLSDSDRLLLAENGTRLAPSGVRQAICEQFLVYSALTKPKERLYLSWPAVGFEDGELKKSVIINKIEEIFPDAAQIEAASPFSSKSVLLSEAAVKALDLKNGAEITEIWADGLKWAYDNGGAELITGGAFYSRRSKKLSEKAVKSLIKQDIYSSITRVEKYIKCPFSYFAEFGLKANERPIYGFKPVDMGNIYHNALDNLSRELEANGLYWGKIENGMADSLIENSVAAACEGLDVLQSSEKNKYLAKRLERIMKRAVWALNYQISVGSFTPYEYEAGFGSADGLFPPITIELSEGYRFIFSGRIDRVDIYDKGGTRYVKIIDYKSGNMKFNLLDVYYGLQLQLMLYMDAYLKSCDNSLPAGIFYFRVTDPVVDYKYMDGEEQEVIDAILSRLRMSGLAVNDDDIINALHNGLRGASNVIPVKLLKPKKADALPQPDANSSVATFEQFYLLMKRAEECIREAGNRLISGDIEPRPVKGVGTPPCKYCGYGALCGFDINAGYRHRNLKKLTNGEVLELLKNE